MLKALIPAAPSREGEQGSRCAGSGEGDDPLGSASKAFWGGSLSLVNMDDIRSVILVQNRLDQFEKKDQMVVNFHNLPSLPVAGER